LNLRVDTEVLSISLSAIASLEDVRSPLAEAWRRAGQVLGESAARAFTFLVTAVPWVPLIALGLWLLVRLWRMVRSRRRHAHHEGAAH
jgi:cytochrome c-type biogenesis protein CcmH/NrfG